jgi:hypothetical protein
MNLFVFPLYPRLCRRDWYRQSYRLKLHTLSAAVQGVPLQIFRKKKRLLQLYTLSNNTPSDNLD